MAEQTQKRQVAYKIKINEILDSKYVKEEGWTPNFIQSKDGKHISRINLIGVVVSKQVEEGADYKSIVIDDGSGRIAVRTFEDSDKFFDVEIGDILLLIGRPREYGNEKYILAEIVKKIKDEKWMLLRKIELDKKIKENAQEKTEDIITNKKEGVVEEIKDEKIESVESENEEVEDIYSKVIEKIKSFDKGDGADIEEVIKDIKEGEIIIDGLLKKGEIFETKPGRVKVLE